MPAIEVNSDNISLIVGFISIIAGFAGAWALLKKSCTENEKDIAERVTRDELDSKLLLISERLQNQLIAIGELKAQQREFQNSLIDMLAKIVTNKQ